jgi:hypothetical protein
MLIKFKNFPESETVFVSIHKFKIFKTHDGCRLELFGGAEHGYGVSFIKFSFPGEIDFYPAHAP